MKLVLAVIAMIAVAPAAFSQGMTGMDMKMESKGAKGSVHKATGVVTKVDPARNKVTIKHGPVQSLNWPSMAMTFTVKDKAMLDKVAKDKKVDFEFREEGKDYVITDMK